MRLWIQRHVEAVGRPVSPKEITEKADRPLSNVGYHVKVLARCGMLTLTETRPVRGSTEHFYVASEMSRRPLVRALVVLRGSEDLDDVQCVRGLLCATEVTDAAT